MTGRRLLGRVSLALAAVALAGGLAACGGGGVHQVKATFGDVGDMQVRGGVQIADVRVGQIDSVKLTRDYKAEVTMSLNKGVKVPKASEALVRTTSLLGEKFIELRPLGSPTTGPFLTNKDTITRTAQAPELEFVADAAIGVLGAVPATDVATLAKTGADAFGGRGPDLNALLGDLSTISATLASRTTQIGAVIDGLDKATTTLAGGANDLRGLLTNLAQTTTILVDNRQRALDALAQLARLARVQNEVLDRYRTQISGQIKQVDAIVAAVAQETGQLGQVVDWLDAFIYTLPKVIPEDAAGVFAWVNFCNDPSLDRVPKGTEACK